MKLVLLPGLDGTGRLFEPLVQVLPADLSPVVVSYPSERLSFAGLVELVKGEVPAGEDYVLLAESFSGPVAIEIAASHPTHLKALVLSATFVSNPSLFPSSLSFLIGGTFFAVEPPQFLVNRYLLGETPPPALVDSLKQGLRSVPPEVLAFRLRSVLNADVAKAFALCQLPTLYLLASQDRVVKPASLARMQTIRPDINMAKIEGPHLLLQREPANSVEAITQFLSRL